MPLISRVFGKLADGSFHSGEDLANALGVTRSAIWKATGLLRELGVSMEAVRNRGYRLATATEPLDAQRIRAALSKEVAGRVRRLDVLWAVGSTNTELTVRNSPPSGSTEILLAEFQSAGRGRRGRKWLAAPGGSVCCSMSWTFAEMPRDAGALSLAIGVCVLRALQVFSVPNVLLKWPNDVLVGTHKLGGILIELRAESGGPACVVVGVGLNLALGARLRENIAATGVAAADLASTPAGARARNAVAASLIEQCVRGLQQFEHEGLRPFVEEWRRADALRGREISVQGADAAARGLARGIDLSGALLVETPSGLRKFISGEVSTRPVA